MEVVLFKILVCFVIYNTKVSWAKPWDSSKPKTKIKVPCSSIE